MPYFESVGHIDDSLPPEEVVKEYRRRYALAAYHRRRSALVTKLGGKCSVCGCGGDLVFVRKDGAPEFRVGTIVTMSAKKRSQLLRHVVLMCEEHSQASLYNKGRVTHGTYFAAYKKKCRCDECGEYMANYALQRRENRRYKKQGLVLNRAA